MINIFKHLFIPHHTNNFRAKLLHADFLAAYVVLFFILSISFKTVNKINPHILGFATDIQTNQLLSLTNQKRADNGLHPLILNNLLSNAAAQKAADMFSNNYWAHNSPQGKTPWDFINSAGYVYTVAGENLAKNFSDSGQVVDAWMNSPTHRENILRSQYQDIGFAIVNGVLNGEETTLVVQMFGNPLNNNVIAEKPIEAENPIIPTETVQAEEATASTQYLSDEDQIEEKKQTATIAAAPNVLKQLEILPLSDSVIKKPIIDIGKISKTLTIVLASILMIILVVDGIFIWRKKIVRIGGKNLAHLFFLIMITSIVWFMSFGSII